MSNSNPTNLVISKSKVTKSKRFSEKTIVFHRADKQATIDGTDIEQVLSQIEDEAEEQGKDISVVVRAMAKDRWLTLKGLQDELNVMDAEDYYRGRVHDPSEFTKFHMLELTILYTH